MHAAPRAKAAAAPLLQASCPQPSNSQLSSLEPHASQPPVSQLSDPEPLRPQAHALQPSVSQSAAAVPINGRAAAPSSQAEPSRQDVQCTDLKGASGPAHDSLDTIGQVQLLPLHDRLRRLELRGPLAPAVLTSLQLPEQDPGSGKLPLLTCPAAPAGSCVPFVARDPRLCAISGTIARSGHTPTSGHSHLSIDPAATDQHQFSIPVGTGRHSGVAAAGLPAARGSESAAADIGTSGAVASQKAAWQAVHQRGLYAAPLSQSEVRFLLFSSSMDWVVRQGIKTLPSWLFQL
jgi:hypothetical protein